MRRVKPEPDRSPKDPKNIGDIYGVQELLPKTQRLATGMTVTVRGQGSERIDKKNRHHDKVPQNQYGRGQNPLNNQ